MPVLGPGDGDRITKRTESAGSGLASGPLNQAPAEKYEIAGFEALRQEKISHGSQRTGLGRLLSTCANPSCDSGWLRLWRSRSGPIFDGGWTCSSQCTTSRIEAAVRRELSGRSSMPGMHRHRVPLGLVMLEQGWITPEQLRQGLEAQKAAGTGKLGGWLMERAGVDEQWITRALAVQWNCAVLPLPMHDAEAMAPALPRLFIEAFGALPLRVAAGQLLYLGFEDRIDPVLSLAAERMLGLRVEAGLVHGSAFRKAHSRMLGAAFPPAELIEAVSEPVLARALTRSIERVNPIEARLVRAHDCLWLRMWTGPRDGPLGAISGIRDVLCSLAGN